MIETFKVIRFKPATLALIGHANGIIGEYQALGFTLTLRQLFYQFVSRPALGLANTFDNYKKLGRIVTDARRAGLIDWDAIEDRTRNVRSLPTWDEPSRDRSGVRRTNIARTSGSSQPYRPEVWIEKDALTGVIEDVSEEFRVPWFSCRGNVSDSEMYAAGKRFARGSRPRPGSARPATRRSRSQRARHVARRSRAPHNVRPPGNRGQAAGAQPRPDQRSAAQLRQGERQPLRGLRPAVRHDRLLGAGRARARTSSPAWCAPNSKPDRPDAWASAIADEEDNRSVLTAAASNWSLVKSALRSAQ